MTKITLEKWLIQGRKLAEETAGASPGSSPIWWTPLPAKARRPPAALVRRTNDPSDPLHPYAADHRFYLTIDLRLLVQRAAVAAAAPLADSTDLWALQGVIALREPLSGDDAVLRHLLSRRTNVLPSPAEGALLGNHLELLAAKRTVLKRWACDLRRVLGAGAPLRLRAKGQPLHVTYVPTAKPAGPLDLPVTPYGGTPLQEEVRWLLSGASWRDGVRTLGRVIVIHLPAYLLVARMLGRVPFALDPADLPESGALKSQWFEAARRWAASFFECTGEQWLSRHEGQLRAAQYGWKIPDDTPVLALRLDMAEAAMVGEVVAKASGRKRRVAGSATAVYDTFTIHIARRTVAKTTRLFFEPPFAVSPTYLEDNALPSTGRRLRTDSRVLWDLHTLDVMAHAGIAGAAEFVRWARKAEGLYFTGALADERTAAKYQQRVGRRLSGEIKSLGPFSKPELQTLRHYFDARERGPFGTQVAEDLSALLPGRSTRGIRRALQALLVSRAREVGWPEFKESGWWPGGKLAQTIFASTKRRGCGTE